MALPTQIANNGASATSSIAREYTEQEVSGTNASEMGYNTGTKPMLNDVAVEKPSIVFNSNGNQPALKGIKRKNKKMNAGAPSANIVRGFETPTASGGEESDISVCTTPRLGPIFGSGAGTSASSSPAIRPSELTRAMSGLKLHLDAIDLERSASQSSFGSGRSERGESDPDEVETGTYEIPLTGDFASAETRQKALYRPLEGGLRTDSPHRKMTASDFEPLKCLGKGAYGTVLLVKQHSTGRLFAQKQLKKASLVVQKRLVEQTKTERVILESVNRHPFVVKLYYAFQDQKKLYLILEYAQGGELFHHLAMERMFTEEVAAFYMAEMVLALEHLHRNLGVVYRDLKPENCLLDAEGHLLLTDFGLSKVAVDESDPDGSGSKCNSILGTIDYMAPEIVRGQSYDAAVDWWSLGALGFDLLTGSPPFSANNYAKTLQKIVHAKLNIPYYLSPDAKDFLTRLLRKEPRKRLGGNMPKDMSTIKGHRFFRRIDWKAMQKRELIAPIQPIITDPAAAENFAQEFTELAMSPVEDRKQGTICDFERSAEPIPGATSSSSGAGEDAFGGFSFVASRSLIEAGEFM